MRETIMAVSVGVISVAWGVRVWMRRLSRDGVETAKDRLEVNVMDLLVEERADLKRELLEANQRTLAADERANKAMRELGNLTARVDIMNRLLELGHTDRLMLAAKIDINTEVTIESGRKADAAYHVSNAVNEKIEKIGIDLKEGKGH